MMPLKRGNSDNGDVCFAHRSRTKCITSMKRRLNVPDNDLKTEVRKFFWMCRRLEEKRTKGYGFREKIVTGENIKLNCSSKKCRPMLQAKHEIEHCMQFPDII
jgi:hypothetical protein